jgi:hypothetical protein
MTEQNSPVYPGYADALLDTTNLPGFRTTYDIAEARLALAIAEANTASGGGGGITQAQVQAAVQNALAAQSFREITQQLIKDSTGLIVVREVTLNENTGALVTVLKNLDGTTYAGALVPPITLPSKDSGLTQRETKYESQTNATGRSIGDQLSLYQVYDDNGVVKFTSWRNDRTGLILATAPTLPIDAIAITDIINDQVKSINSQLTTANSYSQTTHNTQISRNEQFNLTSDGSDNYVYDARPQATSAASYSTEGGWLAFHEEYGVDVNVETSYDGGTWFNVGDVEIFDYLGNLNANNLLTAAGANQPPRYFRVNYPFYRFTCNNNGNSDPVSCFLINLKTPQFQPASQFEINAINNVANQVSARSNISLFNNNSVTVAAGATSTVNVFVPNNSKFIYFRVATNPASARFYVEATNWSAATPTLMPLIPLSHPSTRQYVATCQDGYVMPLPATAGFSWTFLITNPGTSPITINYENYSGNENSQTYPSANNGTYFDGQFSAAAAISTGLSVLPRSLWFKQPRRLKMVLFRSGTITNAETVTLQSNVTHILINDPVLANISTPLTLTTVAFAANQAFASVVIDASSALLNAMGSLSISARTNTVAAIRVKYIIEY